MTINGQPLNESSYIYEPIPFVPGVEDCTTAIESKRCFGPYTVPAGELWVMGDHRSYSADSSYGCQGLKPEADPSCQGPVPVDNVIGKAVFIVMPPSRWGTIGNPDVGPQPQASASAALTTAVPTTGGVGHRRACCAAGSRCYQGRADAGGPGAPGADRIGGHDLDAAPQPPIRPAAALTGRRQRSTAARPDLRFEKTLLRRGYLRLAAMDEVGRGALAGPVSVGVVVVTPAIGRVPAGLRDSKLLTPAARDALVGPVRRWVREYGVGHASADEIDAIGIMAALRLAARRALDAVGRAGRCGAAGRQPRLPQSQPVAPDPDQAPLFAPEPGRRRSRCT